MLQHVSNDELWDVYTIHGDRTNEIVSRGTQLTSDQYHIVVQVWVRNLHGDYLIQQRGANLSYLPGLWATTAGHVVAGETPREGASRELFEELGLQIIPEKLELVRQGIVNQSISMAFFAECRLTALPNCLQAEEVDDVRWASAQEILRMIEAGTFYDYGRDYLDEIFSYNQI